MKISKLKDDKIDNIDRYLVKIIDIYASFYKKLYFLETVLKNNLIITLKEKNGETWFINQVAGIETIPLIKEEMEQIKNRKGSNYKVYEKDLINESSFGFWVEVFNKQSYKLLKGLPIKAFKNLPKDKKRKDIYADLFKIKILRNNIYHHKINSNVIYDIKFLNEICLMDKKIKDILCELGFDNLRYLKKDNFKSLISQAEKILRRLK
jgi:hypothetical protein